MIIQCIDESVLPKINSFIGDDFIQVPYLYANLQRYGIGNDDIQLWIDSECDNISAVYLKYYNCLHFFTKSPDYPSEKFLSMVKEHAPKVIMLQDSFGLKIESKLTDKYHAIPEYIVKLIPQNGGKQVDDVTLADESDIKEVTDLLMTDSIYRDVYTWSELYNQLIERHRDVFGKCFIIRRDNKIVTAYVINAESDKYYVLGGHITHSNYRRQGLGQRILEHVVEVLSETKLCISFLLTDNTAIIELHKKIGIFPENFIRKYYIK